MKDIARYVEQVIEDEIHFLCHCEGYKELRSNFIRYLEINDHSTNLEDSDSIRNTFKTKKNEYSYQLWKTYLLNATEFGKTLSAEI